MIVPTGMNMIVPTTKAIYTPEDLLTMPDGDIYELVNGQLVETNMSMWASFVTGAIIALLRDYCSGNRLGWIFAEATTYQCFADHPDMVRKPDVSFIQLSRLSIEQAQARGHCRIAPDLAVEVLSPNDVAYEVDEKVSQYLAAGVRLVWVVNPEQRTVAVHRPAGQGTILRENDEITGEEVLPGFRCRVGDFFVPPQGIALNR